MRSSGQQKSRDETRLSLGRPLEELRAGFDEFLGGQQVRPAPAVRNRGRGTDRTLATTGLPIAVPGYERGP